MSNMSVLQLEPRVQPADELPPLPGGLGALYDAMFRGAVRTIGFGRLYPNRRGKLTQQNWTFKHLQNPEDASVGCSITRYLPEIAERIGVREILVPSPVDFNGKICGQEELLVRIPLGDNLVIRRGVRADGCLLLPGQAFAVSLGGCAFGWMHHPGWQHRQALLVSAHKGLRSVVDYQRATTGVPGRKVESVIEAMWHSMGMLAAEIKNVQVCIGFPIDPMQYHHRWNHRVWGEKNEILCRYLVERWGPDCIIGWDDPKERRLGRINLGHLIYQQCLQLGIPAENIHGTYSFDRVSHTDGKSLWCNTRGKLPSYRNLGLIVRYA